MPSLSHNKYFDDQVQSIGFERNGRRATVGVIAPGTFHFGTQAPERMTIISGELAVKPDGGEWARYAAGTREILECWFDQTPIRDEYLIVDGTGLAGAGAHSYSAGDATGGSDEAARFKAG